MLQGTFKHVVRTKHKFMNINVLKTRQTARDGGERARRRGSERLYFVERSGRKRISVLASFQASPSCPSDRAAGKLKVLDWLKSVT